MGSPFRGITVVFDLDGTLVDTAPDLLLATNHVLSEIGLPPAPADKIRPVISHGARAMIVEALRLAKVDPGEAGEERVDAMLANFLTYYAENIAVESRPFPGVEVVLQTLVKGDARLAICTNKRANLSHRLLASLGLKRYFHGIAGRDTLSVCKPDPSHLVGSIILAKGDLGRAVMVGDSATDVKTAKAAGIPVIGVSFGYSDVPMRDLKPEAVIDHYDQLLDHVLNLAGTVSSL